MQVPNFNYFISGVAPLLYPTDVFFGLLFFDDDEAQEVPKLQPFQGEWGNILSTHLQERETYPMPYKLDMIYLSIVERKFFSIEIELPTKRMEELWGWETEGKRELKFTHIVLGMAPTGGIALWFRGFNKSILIKWIKGDEVEVKMKDFKPRYSLMRLDELCDFYINNDLRVKENLEKHGLPPRDLFDKYMQQFTYRYLLLFEKWDGEEKKWCQYKEDEMLPEFEYIEEALFDGTHDKLHDGGLLKYHDAGKPKKLALKWHVKKSEYVAYFWFEDEQICSIYDKFYGAHRDTKVDFIIRIDVEKKKFQLALYRYGLKEPFIIPEDTYQQMVFKNKFEYYRSDNYNQERGAWIW